MSHEPDEIRYADVEGRTFDSLSASARPTVRDSLIEVCLMCGAEGHWSSLHANAIYTAPAGHRLEYIEGRSLIVIDSCQKHLVF